MDRWMGTLPRFHRHIAGASSKVLFPLPTGSGVINLITCEIAQSPRLHLLDGALLLGLYILGLAVSKSC